MKNISGIPAKIMAFISKLQKTNIYLRIFLRFLWKIKKNKRLKNKLFIDFPTEIVSILGKNRGFF